MKKVIPLLLLLVVLTAGCDMTGLTVTTTSESPVISSFGADPPTIAAGESSMLSWNVLGATNASIDQGIGSVALSSTRTVMPSETTVYTLTATNASGMSATATAQVIVTGGPTPSPPPAPSPTPSELPVVNYFAASPPIISSGDSTTLGWDVSNATSVTIEPGVGSVAPVGTTLVSPATSTNYILTASNAIYSYSLTITVLVAAVQPAGEPDLVIQDISRAGDKISYEIKNQGDATAGPSTSTLLIDTVVVANDSVGSLAPGESRTETFAGYDYACTLPSDTAVVEADTGDAVAESSEVNNSYTESLLCMSILITKLKLPDLVIEDIWLVPEAAGDRIWYRIKNEGTAASGDTVSALYISPCKLPCLPVATDTVASLEPGESRKEKFAAYNYSGSPFWSVTVKADSNGDALEFDESNNSRSEPDLGL